MAEEVPGAIAQADLTADLRAAIRLPSPRNFLNTGSTAAAVAFDGSGVYAGTDS